MSPLDQFTPEALQALLETVQERIRAAAVTKATFTIAELWDLWEPWAKQNIPSVRICLAHKKPLLEFFGALPWEKADVIQADAYHMHMAKKTTKRGRAPSPTYVQRQLTTLQSMLSWHLERKRIQSNPIAKFTRINEEPYARQTLLTEEQFQRFIARAHPTFQDIATVSFRSAGMRNSEARLLKKEEVNLQQKTITLSAKRTKTRRQRVVPFGDEVAEIIDRNMGHSRGPYVFVRPNDPRRMAPVPAETLRNWIVKARESSGITGVDGENVVFHTFRHSGVTDLLTKGAQPAFVQAAAGLSPRVMPRYTKFQSVQQETLRELMNQRIGPKPASTSAVPIRLVSEKDSK